MISRLYRVVNRSGKIGIMVIQKLNPALIEKIRGSFTINTLTQCASELVLNSLDANSGAIAVRLNLITLKVQVIDNGEGISRDSMDLIGRRFYTSKCSDPKDLERNLKTHGYRGQALANISECSKSVTITSRRRDSSHTYSKIIGKGFDGDVNMVRDRASAGTTVTVEGFFYCLPVRKRRIVAEVVLGDIKKYLECLLLMHPKVSFTLKDDVTNELVLESPNQNSVLSRFRHLHPDVLDVDCTLLNVSKGTTTVEGLLCKELSKNKNLQYLYVNKRPVHSTKTLKFISGLFLSRNKKHRENKHPIFVVNVKCPYSEVDLMLNSTETTVHFKHGNLVMRCLEKLIASLFGEKTSRKPEEKTAEARPPSECSISKIRGAVKVKGFKRDIEKIHVDRSPPPMEKGDYEGDQVASDPDDERGGKGLIMDMFLKSTRVFKSEKSGETHETVFEEEANLCYEKTLTGVDMKKTTSMCMNLKSTRKLKKKQVKLQNTAVQTSFQVNEPRIPDGDFTIVFNDDKVDFLPIKEPNQDQPMTSTPPQHYRKPGKVGNTKGFNLFAMLPSSSPPRPQHHPYPTHYEPFQPQYPTHHYFPGCNGNCCMQPAVPHFAPNFYNPGCDCENCHNRARDFTAPNMDCECVKNRYFKAPHAKPVRFKSYYDKGCRHESNHGNFLAPQPGPGNFLINYRNLDSGFENGWGNSGKNPQANLPRHYHNRDLGGYKYSSDQYLGHTYQGNQVTQNLPQADSPHQYSYINFEKNQPIFNNYPEFGRDHGNKKTVEDLPETVAETEKTPTKKKESPKPFKELKPDFLFPRKQGEDVPDFGFNFQSAQLDQQDDQKFNTNFRKPTRENPRDTTEFNPNPATTDKDEDNFTEFTAKLFKKHRKEDVAEFHSNLSNQDVPEFNPDFMNTYKDQDNFTEFTAKFLSTHNAQKDEAEFASNDISELFQGKQRNPFQIATQKFTRDNNDEGDGVVRSEEYQLPKDWVRKRKRKGMKFLSRYEN